MQIYEYQVKKIYQAAGIPVLKGNVAYTPKEAYEIAKKMDCDGYIVKSQIPAYLRGEGTFIEDPKRFGFCKVSTPKQVQKATEAMLFKHLQTPLTNGKAFEVKKVYIEEIKKSVQRFYLSMRIDFENQRAVLDARKVVKGAPPLKTVYQEIKLSQKAFSLSRATKIAVRLGLPRSLQEKMAKIIQSLYQVFIDYKAFEVNIDPLILTEDKKFYAMSGKIAFDPDAAAQSHQIASLIDLEEETKNETRARLSNCRFIDLEGNIACIINGSGLGMATLDLLYLYGGRAACLFDVGTEPTKEMTALGFKAVLSEPDVEGVFVNILGGSARCDIVAEGLVSAAREISVGIPIVVRLEGSNEQAAERILFESGLPFIIKKKMEEGVKVIIQSVQEIT